MGILNKIFKKKECKKTYETIQEENNIPRQPTVTQTNDSISIPNKLEDKLYGIEDLQVVIKILSDDNFICKINGRKLYCIINDLSKVFRVYPQYNFVMKVLLDTPEFDINKFKIKSVNDLNSDVERISTQKGFSKDILHEIFTKIAKGVGNNFVSQVQTKNTTESILDNTLENKKTDTHSFIWDFIKNNAVSAIDTGIIQHNKTDSTEITNIKNSIYTIPLWNRIAGLVFKKFEININTNNVEVTYKITFDKSPNYDYRFICCHDNLLMLLFDKSGKFIKTIKFGENNFIDRGNLWRGDNEELFNKQNIGLILMIPGLFAYDSRSFERSNFGNSSIFNNIYIENFSNKRYKIENQIVFANKRSFLLMFNITNIAKWNFFNIEVEIEVNLKMLDSDGDIIYQYYPRIWTETFNYTKLKSFIFIEEIKDLPFDFNLIDKIYISIM